MKTSKRGENKILSYVTPLAVIIIFAAAALIFGLLYLDIADVDFIRSNALLIKILFSFLIGLSAVLAVTFVIIDREIIYKLLLIFLLLAALFLFVLYITKVTGLWDKIDSIEDLREYVSSYGRYTIPAFILIQFLQVVILPVPGMITIGAGVALFGAFYGALYSFIGILSASFVAYFIGKKLGYKVASWLVGKETLDKWLKVVKGKDRVVLTFMFIFPFFPDDVLCFVAGLSSMGIGYYSIMITVTRLISVYGTAYSFSGSIIPYNTWWGIVIWAIIFFVTVGLCYLIYKKGNVLEKRFKKIFKLKGKNGKNRPSRRSE